MRATPALLPHFCVQLLGLCALASTEPGFGELLRTYRITAGLSQEDLAARAGLSAHGISDLERGARTRPYAATVQRLVEALDLSEADARRLHTVARALPSGQSKAAAQDGRTAKPSTLVGRASEYSILLEALTAATRGRGSLVTIAGDAGIGKTALCQQLADHAVTHNVVVLISHCFEVSLARPYTPFVEALHGTRRRLTYAP